MLKSLATCQEKLHLLDISGEFFHRLGNVAIIHIAVYMLQYCIDQQLNNNLIVVSTSPY